MSWAISAAAVMAAGSVASNVAANKQAGKNARASAAQTTEEAQANYQSLVRNYKVTTNNINNSIAEANNAIGMELSQTKLDALKAEGNTSAILAERGFVGNTAGRISDNVGVKSALLTDQVMQKAESNYQSLLSKLDEARYNFENGAFSNELQAKNQATQIENIRQSNTTSTLGIVTKAVGAGMSGYSAGKSISGAFSGSGGGGSSGGGATSIGGVNPQGGTYNGITSTAFKQQG